MKPRTPPSHPSRYGILLTLLLTTLTLESSVVVARSSTPTFLPERPSLVVPQRRHRRRQRRPKPFTVGNDADAVLSNVKGGGADGCVVGGGSSAMSTSVFNLVKAIVGIGMLSLPAGVAAFGDNKSAIYPAVLLIAVAGILSGYNFSLMGRICSYTSATSYSSAWTKTVGPSTAWIPAVAVFAMTLSCVLAYSMVLSETFVGIADMVGIQGGTRTRILLGLTGTTLLPLCLMKDLASLAPFSLLGIAGMVLTVLAMGVRYFDGSYALWDGRFLAELGPAVLPSFGSAGASSVLSPKAFVLLGMLSTAYMAHFNAPKFYTELEDNTIERYNRLVGVSFGLSIVVFAAATALGFGTFGKSCGGFVLSNYASGDKLIGASRVAVAFALIFTYPLVFVGCRDGIMDVLDVPLNKRTPSYQDKLTFAILSLVTALAWVLDDVSMVLSLAGATLGNAMIYVLPALMYRKVVKDMGEGASEGMKREVWFTDLSCAIGVGMGVIGTKMALKK